MKNIIEVKNLKKEYGDFKAVKGVIFNVKEGEIFGFLGPNGKSTTINMLSTIKNPTSGTAYENLRIHSKLYRVEKSLREERISEVLKMVELEDKRDNIVSTFSGGMKRRLEIARGLLHHPKVLFLDELTVGVDPQTREHIWEYILKLKEEAGITIFLTTHYMDEAEFCDRIAIMDHGELIALDTPNSLKNALGGDIMNISTSNNKKAINLLKNKYGKEPKENENIISFNVEKGNEFL